MLDAALVVFSLGAALATGFFFAAFVPAGFLAVLPLFVFFFMAELYKIVEARSIDLGSAATHAPYAGQLQSRSVEIDPEGQSEDVHLEAFLEADEDTGHPEEGELDPSATRCR